MARGEVLNAGPDGGAEAAPARSVRRATARRASSRRATARERKDDTKAKVVDLLAERPNETAGDLARALSLAPEKVAIAVAQLEQAGHIVRASHGYRVN